MRRSSRLLSLLALATFWLPIAIAQRAAAHGTVIVPQSRVHRCAFDGDIENHSDPACRAAIQLGGTQAMYDWNGVRQGDADGRHMDIVPDGKLCSGGNPSFVGLDLPRSDWRTTKIVPDANGRFEFVWHATAPHATRDYAFYLTRDGYDPTVPLRWSDVDLFCAAGEVPLVGDGQGRQVYRIPCDLPARSGRHVVFATWQRSDSKEAFYSCSDVELSGGGVDDGWKQIGAIQAPTRLEVGTTVTFRLFDESGGDLERISLKLKKSAQVSRAKWPFLLAKKVNKTSRYARIGTLSSNGQIVPTKVVNGNLVYAVSGRSLGFAVDVTKPGTNPPGGPVYPTGLGSYGPGNVVRGTDGFTYECRPYPNSGWCNQSPPHYAPGTGSDWEDAWIRR